MNKKWFPVLLVIILAVLVILLKKNKEKDQPAPKPNVKNTTTKPVNRDRGFDRRISYLEYSNHAKCRMGCRHISQAEVEQVMKEGKINYNKSQIQNARCPEYAVESTTNDGQRVRIVFGQCNEKTVVITVIDLDTEYSCSCPGDDKKHGNR